MKSERSIKTIELIDKDRLLKSIWDQAHIGGEERLLSYRELEAVVDDQHVESTKQRIRIRL